MQRTTTRDADEEQPLEPAEPRFTPAPDCEAARLRNYDHWQGHSIRVEVLPIEDGEPVAERHYLAPGQTAEVVGELEPGEHDVHVWVDGVERAQAVCRLDETPAGTAIVELGNGVVSVTQNGSGGPTTA